MAVRYEIALGDARIEGPPGVDVPAGARRGETVAEFAQRQADTASAGLLALLEADRRGELRLELAASQAPADDPSLDYVRGYESLWPAHVDLFDFVGRDDAHGRFKQFQADLYWRHLGPILDTLAASSPVLDAGCGVGRLAVELWRRGFSLACADASPSALKAAVRHLLQAGADARKFRADLCDVRRLPYGDEEFSAVLAIELVCYLADPEVALAEIRRVARRGAPVFIAVESAIGAVAGDARLDLPSAERVLREGRWAQPGSYFVQYYNESELRQLVVASGLTCERIIGTHYTADGVFGRLSERADLRDPAVRQQLLLLEDRSAADPAIRPCARSWLAICRKP